MNLLRRWLAGRRDRREGAVLAALAEHPDGCTAYELSCHLGEPAGSMHPTLARLERDGRIRSWWIADPPIARRRYGLPKGEIR